MDARPGANRCRPCRADRRAVHRPTAGAAACVRAACRARPRPIDDRVRNDGDAM